MRAATFFNVIFGTNRGFVCIAIKKKDVFKETFYRYPDQLKDMHEFVERSKYTGNVYFCPQLLSGPQRTKTNVVATTCVWADLDTCHPRVLLVRPTIALETSPNRFQAFWSFDEARDPTEGESIARRVAYYHSEEGADRSGWDLTQLLRIPGTRNFKYGDGPSAPEVKVVEENDVRYRPSDFAQYPQAEGYEHLAIPFPSDLIIEDGIKIVERYRFKISGSAQTLFHDQTDEGGDRSTRLFRLEMLCAEAGMEPNDIFQVARDAKCNKWQERPDLLWRDVCRAIAMHAQNLKQGQLPSQGEPELITDQERKDIEGSPGFVERYIAWAKTLGDAAIQYHQAGAFIALSSLLSGSIVLPTSFGVLIPNLWLMILADTTISRKTTAMNLVIDLITEVDDTLLMATDGSIEGLTTALSTRPGKVSIFFRDEFTGLMEQMTKKDYMAGMPEFFTQLYDSRTVIRRLRKEEVRVKDPRLIIFAGGIKSRMQSLVTFEHVSSGFLPRFIFVTATTDPSKVKPLGPPTERNWGARDTIKEELSDIYACYKAQVPVLVGDKIVGTQDKVVEASLTDAAWARFNRVDQTMMQTGMDAGDFRDILTPLYARLGFSMLKAAVLMAAARTRNEGQLVVTEEDIIRATYYGETWKRHAQDIVVNIGKGPMEHKIELIAGAIHKADHMARSAIMQRYHLNSHEMTLIGRTLEERGQVHVTQHGRQQIYQSLLSQPEKVAKQ